MFKTLVHVTRYWPKLHKWMAKSLANRITAAALISNFIIMLLISLIAYGVSHILLKEKVNAELRSVGTLTQLQIQDRLHDLLNEAESLSKRSLITNALVDSQERSAYLTPFLREIQSSNPYIKYIALYDHRSRVIEQSSESRFVTRPYQELAQTVISSNKPHIVLFTARGTPYLLVIYPVSYPPTGSIEGTLAAEIDLSSIFNAATDDVPISYQISLMNENATLLKFGQEKKSKQSYDLAIDISKPLKQTKADLHTVPLFLRVSIGTWQTHILLFQLAALFVCIALIGTFVVRIIFTKLMQSALAPLHDLNKTAQEIAEHGHLPKSTLPINGEDEIAHLGRAFGRMLSTVRNSQANLETKVEARTLELTEARARLAGILDSLQDVVYSISLEHTVLYISPAANNLYGIPDKSFYANSKQRFEMVHPDDQHIIEKKFSDVPLEYKTEFQYRIVRPDGEIRWVLERRYPILNKDQVLSHVDGIISDITAQILSEEARARAEELLQLKNRALEASSNGIVIADMNQPHQPIIYVNPAFEKISGYTASEVINKNCRFLQGVDSDQPGIDEIRLAIQEQRECHVIIKNYHKDGSLFWNELSLSPVKSDETGKVTHYIGIQNDISLKRQAEQNLFDWFVRLDTIFTLSPDGFVSFDASNRIAYVNPGLERMIGKNSGDLLGLSLAEFDTTLSTLGDKNMPYHSILSTLHGQHVLQSDKDGAESLCAYRNLIHLRTPKSCVLEWSSRDSGSEAATRVIYFRDITRESEIDRMKSEFLSTAAHELRTPMASIMGFSELLLRRRYDETRTQDMLETINRQSSRLTHLLNELLDLARIEARAGKDFDMQSHSLETIVSDTIDAFHLPGDLHHIVCQLTRPLPNVFVDSAKLQQALTNILSNAYKYSPAGGKIILRTQQRINGPRKYIGLFVQDFGIGMTPAQLNHACERFYRADTSGNIPGTGLGLSLVKEIVEIHGGDLEIMSEYGRGTCVAIWLPLVQTTDHPSSQLATCLEADEL